MTLANMRANGVRTLVATCEACGHKADGQLVILLVEDRLPNPDGNALTEALKPFCIGFR
jgi:hypothetical protein